MTSCGSFDLDSCSFRKNHLGQTVLICGIDDSAVPYLAKADNGEMAYLREKGLELTLDPVPEIEVGDTVEVTSIYGSDYMEKERASTSERTVLLGKKIKVKEVRGNSLRLVLEGEKDVLLNNFGIKLISKGGKMETKVFDGIFQPGDRVEIFMPKPSIFVEVVSNHSWTKSKDAFVGMTVTLDKRQSDGSWGIKENDCFVFPECMMKFLSRPEKVETPVTLERFKEAIKKVDWKAKTPLEALLASAVKWLLKGGDQSAERDNSCPTCLKNFDSERWCGDCQIFKKEMNAGCCPAYFEWRAKPNSETSKNLALYILGKAIEEMERK